MCHLLARLCKERGFPSLFPRVSVLIVIYWVHLWKWMQRCASVCAPIILSQFVQRLSIGFRGVFAVDREASSNLHF